MKQNFILKILTVIMCLGLAINLVGCNQKSGVFNATARPGWTVIKGEGVALSLPQEFVGGNPGRELDKITEQLKTIDPNSEKKLLGIKQNPTAVSLLAFDPNKTKTPIPNSLNPNNIEITNVNITNQALPQNATVNSIMENDIQELTKAYQVIENKIVSINQQESARITVFIAKSSPEIKQLFYLIPRVKEKKVWVVTYTTLSQEFDRLLPVFEESIGTLQIFS